MEAGRQVRRPRFPPERDAVARGKEQSKVRQPILIIPGFCTCECTFSLKFICKPKSTLGVLSWSFSDVRRAAQRLSCSCACSPLRSSKMMLHLLLPIHVVNKSPFYCSLFSTTYFHVCAFVCFCFLGPHLGLFGTATATSDLSRVCNLHCTSRQCRILNPLSEAGVKPPSLWILIRFITAEPQWKCPCLCFLSVILLFKFIPNYCVAVLPSILSL